MNGIIIINKPQNCTSHDVVYKVRKILNTKVGHSGTLDPMATGVLPILIGRGTLLSKYLVNHDKIYDVVLKLGTKTDTADCEGNIICQENVDQNILNEINTKQILKQLIGKQKQIPPMYSAIKYKGKKLYEYARKGIDIEVEPREIEIYDINLLLLEREKLQLHFRVNCSKGTYIRSLCEDISTKLGTVGYMKSLNRIQVGDFIIDKSINLHDIRSDNIDFIKQNIISIEEYFINKGKIVLNNKKLKLFLNGVKLSYLLGDDIYRIYNNNNFIGLGEVRNKLLKRDII